jgi:GNAT superfamily N-acetyltransferase
MRWAGPDGYWASDEPGLIWLCDVFVDTAHRDHGLGVFLVETAADHPAVRGVRQLLAAEPGRSLYRRLGYVPLGSPERWLERRGRQP